MNRVLTLARFSKSVSTPIRSQIRHSGHYIGYRELNYMPDASLQKNIAEVLAGISWWLVMWNMCVHWSAVVGIGHCIMPDRSQWSDEELGIPEK